MRLQREVCGFITDLRKFYVDCWYSFQISVILYTTLPSVAIIPTSQIRFITQYCVHCSLLLIINHNHWF